MKLNLQNTYNFVIWNEEKNLSLAEILGNKKTILFFYPKDNTPWCTVENKDFTCLQKDFEALWYQLIWVSKDSVESHKKFIEKQELKNGLISDPELILHKELWAYGEKNNYGKIVMGVIRSTFIINKNGKIEKEYRNIRAKGHAERILKEL